MTTFTLIHVAISLAGIVSGLVVARGLRHAQRLDGWTSLFLVTTILTSVTGFGFPSEHLLPSHIVGILSLAALALATFARYSRRLAGPWRATYVVGAVVALYFNVFVLIVQLFQKVPSLQALAPTQSEPPFLVAQCVALAAFVWLGIVGVSRFRPHALRTA